MSGKTSTAIAIGGGDIAQSTDILDKIFGYLEGIRDPRVTVMTVATSEPEAAASKYNGFFRRRGVKHVDVVDVSMRDDAFNERSIKKLREADALFFTGGDQLNITSLMGGSPLHNLVHDRMQEGILITGTSAGAAMMSSSMIISGRSDTAPRVAGVEIAPGMDMIKQTIIDTHFAERGRHGRLLTAIAHYRQVLGIGIDEKTAIVFNNGTFTVCGVGGVTVVDGSKMTHTDLPYKHDGDPVGLFGVQVHVLPAGYSYDLESREPIAPPLAKMAGNEDE